MVDSDNKEIEGREISASEQSIHLPGEKKEGSTEQVEMSSAETEMIREELRREIELMDTDPGLKKQAEDKARVIGSLATDQMLEHLLEVAREKGLVSAIFVAKKMNKPDVLDTFHDLLAREGYYKKFAR